MPTARTIMLWSLVHKWTSLISTVFMLLLCVTGLPLIFHHEIDDLLGDGVELPVLAQDHRPASLDGILAALEARWPDEHVQFLGWDRDEPGLLHASLAPTIDAPLTAERRPVAVDGRSAAILAEAEQFKTFNAVMWRLHVDLYAGLPGKLFLGFMGLLLVVSLVSGVVLYAPFMRRLDFGTVRRGRSTRIKWLDLHNLLGIVTLTWLLVVGGTGVLNTWLDLGLGMWRAGQLAEMAAPYQGQPPAEERASFDAVVAAARQAAPGMDPAIVAFPRSGISTSHHFVVFMRGGTPFTARLLKPVLIDAASAEVTDSRTPPWYLTTLLLSQPLHFGDYGGMPLRIIWALLDVVSIVVLSSGLYLWFAKRRGARAREAMVQPAFPLGRVEEES
jgi:Uncharacterized iron-regulated membrane protein